MSIGCKVPSFTYRTRAICTRCVLGRAAEVFLIFKFYSLQLCIPLIYRNPPLYKPKTYEISLNFKLGFALSKNPISIVIFRGMYSFSEIVCFFGCQWPQPSCQPVMKKLDDYFVIYKNVLDLL